MLAIVVIEMTDDRFDDSDHFHRAFDTVGETIEYQRFLSRYLPGHATETFVSRIPWQCARCGLVITHADASPHVGS